MKRIYLIILLVVAALLIVGSVAAMQTRPATIPDAPMQPAGTIIVSDITTDTTWTKVGSPYLVTADASVLPGVTLTVEQGVTVQFQQFMGLTVRGSLAALGTYTEPITFTAMTAQPGWWKGISIKGAISAPISGSVLSYAAIEYGGAQNLADLYVEYAEVKVSHGTFRYSATDGVYGSYTGIAHIANSGFFSNTRYAVQFYDGSINPALWNLTATGNGYDAVGLGLGTRQGAHEWTATGIPYILMADETVAPGATLTVDPGVTVQALQASGLTVNGRLMAMGIVSAPITFTGYFTGTPTPGWWKGLHVQGDISAPSAAVRLDHAVVEYAGYGSNPNVYVQYGRAAISNSRIQASSGDGVYISYGAGGSTIAASHIISNAGYGVYNQDAQVVVAANDWWGAASGPQVDPVNSTDCNPGGVGSRVSTGVAFRPFLTSVMQDPGSFAPGDVRSLTLTPLRWFVPADGNSRAYVTLTLRDGAGNPVPGRNLVLGNTIGTASSGGITDVRGQTFAYVTSNVTGEATLTGILQDAATCEYVRSASATVTFTPVSAGLDVMPGSPAPYVSGGIEVDPLPVTQGQPTTLQARITNPTTSTLIVTGTFDYVQSSIGMVFGPILGSPEVVTIPPLGQGTLQTQWIPPVQGHYCVAANLLMKMDDVPGESPIQKTYQRNWDVLGGDLWSDQERSALAHLAAMNMPPTVDLLLPAVQSAREASRRSSCLNNIKASLLAASLATAQPRLDYRAITLPQKPVTSPLALDSGFSPEFIAAYNGYMDAMADVIAYERAIKIALDRYAGAAEAGDLQWASQQVAVKQYYQKLLGRSAEAVALYRDTLSRTPDVGGLNVWVSATDVISYQNHLQTQGFSQDEIDAAHALGMNDAEIEAMRQAYLAADPQSLAGNVLDYQARLAATLQQLGEAMTGSTNVPPQASLMATSVTPALRAGASVTPNNLARVYASTFEVAVGNPLTQTAAIELRVRRVDLPSDWTATVTPTAATLAPGTHITATVTVEAWSPVAQGYQPRVAVEGYVSGTLIGGVALDVLVPQAAVFDGRLRVYLPLVLR